MDTRITLNATETFLNILNSAMEKKEKVNLITDKDGLIRKEGFIKSVIPNDDSTTVELDNGEKFQMETIVAVNGIFRPEYGEC